jgi:hypothetical protein
MEGHEDTLYVENEI